MNLKKWLNLESFVYLALFSLPLYLVRINFFVIPTNMLEILIGITFFLWLALGKKKHPLGELFQYKRYYFSLSLILIGLIFSAIFSGGQTVSWGIIKGWFLFPILFLFLMIVIVPAQNIKKLFLAYFFGASLIAMVALLYLILGKITYDQRLTAFFNSANYLAMYLSPAIIIGLVQMEKNKIKSLNAFFFALLWIAFYFTYSYSAWMTVLLTSLIIWGVRYGDSLEKELIRIIKNKKTLIIIAILAVVLMFQFEKEKFVSLVSFDERSSLSSRMMIWKASLNIVGDNFWWGIGAGNFQEKYLAYQKFYPPYLEWAVPHPHSLYLSFWLYGGIFSFVGFLSLVTLYFKDIFAKIKKENDPVFFMSLGIILVVLIHGVVDTTYFKNDLAIIFWLSFVVLRK